MALTDPVLLNQAAQEYAAASRAYADYLKQFPESENAYEVQYSYASCLYYSQRFLEAAVAFAQVRDARPGGQYHEEAAFSDGKILRATPHAPRS